MVIGGRSGKASNAAGLLSICVKDRVCVPNCAASVTDVFDFYGRDLAMNSRHALIIEETGRRLIRDR